MINKILCLSRKDANVMKSDIISNSVSGYDNVFCISIHGSPFIDGDEGGELFSLQEWCETRISNINRILSLEFDDVCPDTVVRLINEAVFMNEGHASLILDRVLEWNKIKGNNLLIVHCAAGICRSGSVARFCAYLLDIELDTIKTNPQILFNNWVTYLLYATYFQRKRNEKRKINSR